jgi:sigma-B regulation protein RsbU (phosphoserine phosphatase)
MSIRRTSTDKHSAYESKFDLGALFEFSSIINASLDLKFILGHFLLTIMGKLLSLRGIIVLHQSGKNYSVENVKGLPADLVGKTIAMTGVPNRLFTVDEAQVKKYPWALFFRELGIHFVIPLRAGNKVLGVAGFAPSAMKRKMNIAESTYLKSLANIAASAIAKGIVFSELHQSNRNLSGKIHELGTLFELGKEFNVVLDSERLIKLLMLTIMGQVGANRYVLCLSDNGMMKLESSRLDKELAHDACAYFSTLTAPQFVDAISKKKDRKSRELLQEAGIKVLIPLRLQNETKGMIGLGSKIRNGEYTSSDLEFLSSLGNLAIISLENARLFQQAIEKQKMEDELLIAKGIQRGLLPAQLPAIPGCDIAAINISSKQVGGDYYDIIQLDTHRYVIAIGDVSGKGTPASLLMANLQATIRALVPLGLPLSELTRRVNDLLCENTGSERFITFFWCILDMKQKSLQYVSAGHNPPLVIHKDGSIDLLEKGGLILGIVRSVPYEEGLVALEKDDVIVLYTDGVTEAMSATGEEWGEANLEAVAKKYLTEPSEKIISSVVEAVKEHSKDTVQSDDITMVVLKIRS